VRRQRLAGFGGQRRHRLVDLARGAHRALDVVPVRDRRAEHRHRRVADVLVDGPAGTRDRAVDELEEAAEEPVHFLGVDLGRELREAGEVGEQDRDGAALAGRRRGGLRDASTAVRAEPCVRGSGARQSAHVEGSSVMDRAERAAREA
jgi:hypothetical protein